MAEQRPVPGALILAHRVVHLVEDRRLVREMQVEGGPVHPCGLRDVPDRRLAISVLLEHLTGRLDDTPPRQLTLLVPDRGKASEFVVRPVVHEPMVTDCERYSRSRPR